MLALLYLQSKCTMVKLFNEIEWFCLWFRFPMRSSFNHVHTRGWYSNIFCILIFVLSQDKSQGTTTEIAGGQKSNCLLAGQGSTSHFTKNTNTTLHNQIISILYITMYSMLHVLTCILSVTSVIKHNSTSCQWLAFQLQVQYQLQLIFPLIN